MKKIVSIVVIILVILALTAGGAYLWYTNGISSANSTSTEIKEFTVPIGSSVDMIGSNLLSAGLIKDKTLFWLYSKFNPDAASKIEAGIFNIPMNSSIEQIYKILEKAFSKDDIRVVILEGLRYDEVITAVSKAFASDTNFSASEMTAMIEHPDTCTFSTTIQGYLDTYKPKGINLEGFLFPDTYYFFKDATAKDVIEKLIGTLFAKLSADDLAKVKTSKYTLHDYLTVASYLEREANVHSPEEMSMIADIIYKRLEHGVENSGVKLLQLDVILSYVEKDWHYFDHHSFVAAKAKDNPYNVFIHPGLTPTPIDNPGMATIHAAINPIANDYYYYIYDLQGRVHYAKTLAQHEQNVAQYL